MGVKIMKRVFISIGILVLVCFSGLFLYNAAYSEGEADGYSDGYDHGNIAGQEWAMVLVISRGLNWVHNRAIMKVILPVRLMVTRRVLEAGYKAGIKIGYEEGVSTALGHGYTIKDSTYKQAIRFLKEDEADKNKFAEDICMQSLRQGRT